MDNPGFEGTSERRQDEMKAAPGVEVADCASGCLRLPVLNRFRSPKWFLVFLSLAACVPEPAAPSSLASATLLSSEKAARRTMMCRGMVWWMGSSSQRGT